MGVTKQQINKILSAELTSDQFAMMSMISIEAYKNKTVFRMPIDVIPLDKLWERIAEILDAHKIVFQRTDQYATLEDLESILSDITWLWRNWIPNGFVTLLVGYPGDGKSMVGLDITKRINRKLPWPLDNEMDLSISKNQRVLWIEAEGAQQILRMRANAFELEKSKVSVISLDGDLLQQVDLTNINHRQQIIDQIENVKPILVVIDSLVGANPGGENQKEDMAPIMEWLNKIARDYNIAILVIHHLRKLGANDNIEITIQSVRGSGSIVAYARSVIAIDKPWGNEDARIRIKTIKSNLAALHHGIVATFKINNREEVCGIIYEKYSPVGKKLTKADKVADFAISALIENDGKIAFTRLIELGAKEGYTRGNFNMAKPILGDRVIIEGTGNKVNWVLVDNADHDAEEHIKNSMKKGDIK